MLISRVKTGISERQNEAIKGSPIFTFNLLEWQSQAWPGMSF